MRFSGSTMCSDSSVREELQAQTAMQDVVLEISVLNWMASGVAAHVDYGFDVRWAPEWVKAGDAHRWSEDALGALAISTSRSPPATLDCGIDSERAPNFAEQF